jgi:hypothetical protein
VGATMKKLMNEIRFQIIRYWLMKYFQLDETHVRNNHGQITTNVFSYSFHFKTARKGKRYIGDPR